MLNMVSLLPHCKKDSKVEAKSSRGATLNELIELKGSSSCLFFEVKFQSFLPTLIAEPVNVLWSDLLSLKGFLYSNSYQFS